MQGKAASSAGMRRARGAASALLARRDRAARQPRCGPIGYNEVVPSRPTSVRKQWHTGPGASCCDGTQGRPIGVTMEPVETL